MRQETCRGTLVFLINLALFGVVTWKAFKTIEDYEKNFVKDDKTERARIACIVFGVTGLLLMMITKFFYFKQ